MPRNPMRKPDTFVAIPKMRKKGGGIELLTYPSPGFRTSVHSKGG